MAFVCFAVLGFYTVPANIYFFASTVLWLLISTLLKDTKAPPKNFILKLAVACAVTAVTVILLYLPLLIVSGLSAFKTPPENWTRTFHALFKGLPGNMKDIWTNWNSGIPLVVSLIIAAGFILSLVVFRKIARDRVNLPIVVLTTTFRATRRKTGARPPEEGLLVDAVGEVIAELPHQVEVAVSRVPVKHAL